MHVVNGVCKSYKLKQTRFWNYNHDVSLKHVKQSRSHLMLLLCWLLSEGQSHPSSVVLQWPQMMGDCGGQKTCRVDRIQHKIKIDKVLSALSPTEVNLAVLHAK